MDCFEKRIVNQCRRVGRCQCNAPDTKGGLPFTHFPSAVLSLVGDDAPDAGVVRSPSYGGCCACVIEEGGYRFPPVVQELKESVIRAPLLRDVFALSANSSD